MPYKLAKRGGKFTVINKRTGKNMRKKATTKKKALAHMRALYVHSNH
jgi:hypothetical protein